MTDRTTDELDLLHGVKEIATFARLDEREAYYLLGKGLLPGQKNGKSWTSSKTAVRRHFALALGEAAAA